MKKGTVQFAVIIAVISVFAPGCSNPGDSDKSSACKSAAPANVSAEAQSASRIRVTWDPVADAEYYTVYRAEKPSGKYTSAEKTFEASFTDTALTSATTYYYKISAHYDCGESAMSDTASATTTSCTKPATPTNVTAEAMSALSIKISWDSIPTASLYEIYRSDSGNGTYNLTDSTANRTYTDGGLTISSTHYYKIIAKNDCGESELSVYASATTNACPKPAAPTNVSAEAKSSSSIEITWDTVSTAVTYKIYRSATSTGTYSPIGSTAGKASTSYIDEGLELAKTYYYAVVAESECEESAQSIYGFATTMNCENTPEAPTNIKAEALSQTEIKVSWSRVSNAKYNIYTKHDSFDYYLIVNGVTDTSLTVSDRTPSRTYYFKVSAENDCGEGELSAAYDTATTTDCNLPILSNPTGITATALSAKSVKITWDVVSGATYDIYRGTERYGQYWTVTGARNLTATTFTDTVLSSSTTYYYAVKALNACGGASDGLGDVVSVTTMCETPIPLNVEAAAKSSSSIEISWDAVSGAVSYSVFRAASQNGTYTLLDSSVSNPTYTDSGLQSSTSYYYRVTAKTETCDESRASATVTAATQ